MAIQDASLTPIYERLNGVTGYHPMSAETFADWSVEAGDMISVSRDSTAYVSPVHSTKIVWRGAPQITINSTGKEKRDTIAKISRRKYGRSGAGMRNDQGIHNDLYSDDGVLHSSITQTERVIRSEVSASNSQIYTYVEQTASYIIEHVGSGRRTYTQWETPTGTPDDPLMEGDIWIKTNFIRTVSDMSLFKVSELAQYKVRELKGSYVYEYKNNQWKLVVDETTLSKDVDTIKTDSYVKTFAKEQVAKNGQLDEYVAELTVEARRIRSDVSASNSQLYSYIEQTATYIRSEVNDTKNALHSEIVQTASSITSTVTAAKSTLYSQIEQTATQIRSEVASTVSGIRSTITQTASQIRSEVTNTVSSLTSSITQNSNKIALVVEERSGSNVIKAASIVTSINDEGSSVAISGDHISITGSSKLSGSLEISDGNLVVKRSAVIQGNLTLTTSGSYIQAPTFSVPSSGKVQFIGTASGEKYDLTTSVLKGMVKSFSVSGNTLTLTPFYGDPVNFSRGAVDMYPNGSSDIGTSNTIPSGATNLSSLASKINANVGNRLYVTFWAAIRAEGSVVSGTRRQFCLAIN